MILVRLLICFVFVLSFLFSTCSSCLVFYVFVFFFALVVVSFVVARLPQSVVYSSDTHVSMSLAELLSQRMQLGVRLCVESHAHAAQRLDRGRSRHRFVVRPVSPLRWVWLLWGGVGDVSARCHVLGGD